MKDEFVCEIGIWGQRHYNYLKRKSPTVINTMRMKGTLGQYLRDIDRDAEEMFSQLVKQLAERDGIAQSQRSNRMGASHERCASTGERNRIERNHMPIIAQGGKINSPP